MCERSPRKFENLNFFNFFESGRSGENVDEVIVRTIIKKKWNNNNFKKEANQKPIHILQRHLHSQQHFEGDQR